MEIFYILLSVVFVSLLSIVAAIPLLIKKQISNRILLVLVGISAGTLLGAVFLHFLPEATSGTYTVGLALHILSGFLVFFIVEKLVHYHHSAHERRGVPVHHHAYHLAPMNLTGEIIHNFIDGLVIAASYLVSVPLGIAATLSVALHELPQEIADFGILLYAGLSKKKALLFNFLASLSAILGALIGIIAFTQIKGFQGFAIPFAIGAFLYIAASNLVPELHREKKPLDSILQLLAVIAGIGIMLLLVLYAPHAHG